MKNIFFVVALVSIICLSCDGRQTKKESLEHAISEFNLTSSPIEMVTYQPEAYVEIVTDTIVSNSVKVSIKNYALLDEQILVSDVKDAIYRKINYQRVFASEIHVSSASKDIFSIHISAKQFKAINADPFWDNATLQHAWVNQELSTMNDINLDISFINPKNKAYKLYRMSIDADGKQTLNLIEEHI